MTTASLTKVAIVGTAPTSKMLAPFADNSWAIWACSAGNIDQLPRVNIWFELHALIEMTSTEMKGMSLPFFKWLREKSEDGTMEVVMLEAGSALGGKLNTFVPKAIPYPRDEMVELFGRNWFSSSVAYMMALAIARGATEIGLFGVDMAADQEHYEAQRAGLVRFIEIARERGIIVHIPPESCLNAAPPMYGYWEGTAFGRRMSALTTLTNQARGHAAQQEQAAHDQRLYFDGALEQLRYMRRTWTDGIDMDADLGDLAGKYEARIAEMRAPKVEPVEPIVTVSELASGEGYSGFTDEFAPWNGPSRDEAAQQSIEAAPIPSKPNGHMPFTEA